MPCKKEEDEVNDRSSRLCGVSARPVSLPGTLQPISQSFGADADGAERPIAIGAWGGPIAVGDEKIHLFAEGLTLGSMAMPQAAPTATERSEVCSRSVASLRLPSVWGLSPGALADVPGWT